MWILDTRS